MVNNEDYSAVTRRFYDEHAEEYVFNTATMLDEEWLERFAAHLPAAGRVLDVGTAGGRDARWFAARGFDVVGIDNSEKMIELARRSVEPGVSFQVADVRDLKELVSEAFDGVWCSCVLIHLSKRDVPVALAELRRVLRPGGVLYALVKEGTTESFEADKRYGGARKYASYFTPLELGKLMSEAGFAELATEGIDVAVDEYRAKDRVFMLVEKR